MQSVIEKYGENRVYEGDYTENYPSQISTSLNMTVRQYGAVVVVSGVAEGYEDDWPLSHTLIDATLTGVEPPSESFNFTGIMCKSSANTDNPVAFAGSISTVGRITASLDGSTYPFTGSDWTCRFSLTYIVG